MEDSDEANVVQRPAKILVVDGGESSRNLLKRRLSVQGHEVLVIGNLEHALRVLSTNSIDVIFLNMYIDDEPSVDFLISLKENERYRNIPVIMISEDNDVELVVKCIEAGAEDYLVKPLNQTLLKARLSNCIARKESHDKEIAFLAKIEQGQKQIKAQEKMASLGTLLSSISQELKNPLNFVINFASVSSEICGELTTRVEENKNAISGEFFFVLRDRLKNFQSNLTKISGHGQKADKILRFMLDQTNASGGAKHPGSINKIISQTITMLLNSYKNNGITTLPKIETEFDNALPQIPISTQSFSKAIYNILDNAFYSVMRKFEDITQAKIVIKTENCPSHAKISIYDNGSGVKQNLFGKIFEPFFTTKPEGTGPGLGLSTALEVAQEHSGTISVNSQENEFAEFEIQIAK
ncbi:MAG: response regulator [Holosporaceae bacterium]|jgi:signal transduction histidine kinase|nr:response regulator [Holosporaceae bacterium]